MVVKALWVVGFLVFLIVLELFSPIVCGSEAVVPRRVPVSVWHLFFHGEKLVSLMDGGFGVVLLTRNISSGSCIVRVIDEKGLVLSRAFPRINVSISLVRRTGYEDFLVISDYREVILYSLPGLVMLWDKVLGDKNHRIKDIGFLDKHLAVILMNTLNDEPRVKVLIISLKGLITYTWISRGYLLDTRYLGDKLLLAIGSKKGSETYALIAEMSSNGYREIGRIPVLNESRGPIGISPNGRYIASIVKINNTYQLLLGRIMDGEIDITKKRELKYKIPINTVEKIIHWSPDSKELYVLETTNTWPNSIEAFLAPSLAIGGFMWTSDRIENIVSYNLKNRVILGIISNIGIYRDIVLIPISGVGGFPIKIERYNGSAVWPSGRGIYVFTQQPLSWEHYLPILRVMSINESNDLVLNGSYPIPLPGVPDKIVLKGTNNNPTIYAALNMQEGTWLFRIDWRKTRIIKETEKNLMKKIIAYAPALDGKIIKYNTTLKKSIDKAHIEVNLSIELIPAQLWILEYVPVTGWKKEVEYGIIAFVKITGIKLVDVEEAYIIISDQPINISITNMSDKEHSGKINKTNVYRGIPSNIFMIIWLVQGMLISNTSSIEFTIFHNYPHSGALEPIKKNPLYISIKLVPMQQNQTLTTTKTTTKTTLQRETPTEQVHSEREEIHVTTTTTTEEQRITKRCIIAGIIAIIMALIGLILYLYNMKTLRNKQQGRNTS